MHKKYLSTILNSKKKIDLDDNYQMVYSDMAGVGSTIFLALSLPSKIVCQKILYVLYQGTLAIVRG